MEGTSGVPVTGHFGVREVPVKTCQNNIAFTVHLYLNSGNCKLASLGYV